MPRLVDLTHPLTADTICHPLDIPPKMSFLLTHEKDGFALSNVTMSAHTGTHMDAPYHMLAEGARLGDFPVARFVGTAVVLDVRGKGPALTREDVELAAVAGGGLHPGDFALVWTGWDMHFCATDMLEHPYLTAEAAAYLRDKGVGLVGTDGSSVDSDMGSGDPDAGGVVAMDFSAHKTLMGANVLIVENLKSLDQLVGSRPTCAILPLRWMGTEGSPVRAIAWLD